MRMGSQASKPQGRGDSTATMSQCETSQKVCSEFAPRTLDWLIPRTQTSGAVPRPQHPHPQLQSTAGLVIIHSPAGHSTSLRAHEKQAVPSENTHVRSFQRLLENFNIQWKVCILLTQNVLLQCSTNIFLVRLRSSVKLVPSGKAPR
jgi:hypothetical protein